ncbi:MAG: UvrD-helicase domain-containing protein, partial [Solirubrobacteraceae bacterium]
MRDDGLTGLQREAVTYPGSSLLVRGVAGSGKTRVIGERYLRLIADGAAPERLAVLVPSAARAAALRERLQLRIAGGYEELVVLTPGELAARVLRAAGPVVGPGDRLA